MHNVFRVFPCFSFSHLVSALFVSDFRFLSPFVVSNMDKEQRRNSPGECDAKQQKNILLTCHPFLLHFFSYATKTQSFVRSHHLLRILFSTPATVEITFLFMSLFCILCRLLIAIVFFQTLEVKNRN